MSIPLTHQCITFLQKFIAKPPQDVFFRIPALRKCMFVVPKIMVRIASRNNPLDWAIVFVYRRKRWSVVGGQDATSTMLRTTFSPAQVSSLLCKSLVKRKGNARLEVDISFNGETTQCDYVEWDTDTDRAVVAGTRMGNPHTVLYFGNNVSFPAKLFECSTTELKFIYDFFTQRRISIWDPRELDLQEKATYTKRHRSSK